MRRLSATTLLGASEAARGTGRQAFRAVLVSQVLVLGVFVAKVGVWLCGGVVRSALGFCVVVCRPGLWCGDNGIRWWSAVLGVEGVARSWDGKACPATGLDSIPRPECDSCHHGRGEAETEYPKTTAIQ